MSNKAEADFGYLRARIADLEIDLTRAEKTIEMQQRATELLIKQLSLLSQTPQLAGQAQSPETPLRRLLFARKQ